MRKGVGTAAQWSCIWTRACIRPRISERWALKVSGPEEAGDGRDCVLCQIATEEGERRLASSVSGSAESAHVQQQQLSHNCSSLGATTACLGPWPMRGCAHSPHWPRPTARATRHFATRLPAPEIPRPLKTALKSQLHLATQRRVRELQRHRRPIRGRKWHHHRVRTPSRV